MSVATKQSPSDEIASLAMTLIETVMIAGIKISKRTKMFKKAVSLIVSFSLFLTQPVFAQVAAELNIGKYLSQMPALQKDSFRPARLRYISYDSKSNDFKLLLDPGDAKLSNSLNPQTPQLPSSPIPELNQATQELFNYFLI